MEQLAFAFVKDIAPLCECGCGGSVIRSRKYKGWNKFIHNHHNIKMALWIAPGAKPPLCACGCGDPVSRRHDSRIHWYTYIKNHDKRRPKPWRYDNSNAPLCSCGCGNPVTRSTQTPYNWNKYIYNHHTATETFVKDRIREPPLCACGCGEPVGRKYLNRGWKKYLPDHHLLDPKYSALLSKRRKEQWADPVMRDRMCKLLKKSGKSPNRFEKDFDTATTDNLQFMGDRALWYRFKDGCNKNPDFHLLDTNKVIELYGSFWHKDDDPEDIISLYAEIGIECLVVWEHDWKNNREYILQQVNNFIERDRS